MALLALGVGVVGGIYGIGGGSLPSPLLVGRGLPVSNVAPAARSSTLLTSIAGALTYAVLAATGAAGHDVAPHWTLAIIAGVGGLVGGYLGAALQSLLPERILRAALGFVAIVTAILYIAQAVT